jgi:hypothetical protein
MVYQLAFHLLADHNDALDLSQDVFLQVFRMLPRFRGQSTLKTSTRRAIGSAGGGGASGRRRSRSTSTSSSTATCRRPAPPANRIGCSAAANWRRA